MVPYGVFIDESHQIWIDGYQAMVCKSVRVPQAVFVSDIFVGFSYCGIGLVSIYMPHYW